MTQNIKNFIEEGEKSENYRLNTILADLKRGAITYDLAKYNVLDWNKNLQISLIKMIVERDIKYWKNIFDNPPKRDKEYPCDNCTQNICRIEITRLEKELLELTDGK